MSKKVELNESNVEKKFQGVTNTQDSIQSLSLWVIHHKTHNEKIVALWFKVLKKSKIPHRLILFYVCNDIIQTCKRKHAMVLKDAFKEVLKDAVLLVRDQTIRPKIERMFKIWEERNIYETDFVEELEGLLTNSKSRATLNTKLLAEFQPGKVMEQLSLFDELERSMKLRAKYVGTLKEKLDVTGSDATKQLKDRQHGKEFSQQFEDTCCKVEHYVVQLERAIKERASLIEILEESELFYDAQYGEAKIVVNAYRNFGSRVANLKKKLVEHSSELPSPLGSPMHDAPSPVGTPPGLKERLDSMETMDMELSDGEGAMADVQPPLFYFPRGSFTY